MKLFIYNFFIKIVSRIQEIFYRTMTNSAFASSMREFGKKFDVPFTWSQLHWLQRGCAYPKFITKVKSVASSRFEKIPSPLVTVVIIVGRDAQYLKRCLFILGKQIGVSLEILIVGQKYSKKLQTFVPKHPVTAITLRSNLDIYNAHALPNVLCHIRGKYIFYMRPTHSPHPSLLLELVTLAHGDTTKLVAAAKGGAWAPRILSLISQVEATDVFVEQDGVFAASNADIYGKLFVTKTWLKVLETKKYPPKLDFWLPLLHTLAYARRCSGLLRSRPGLLHETTLQLSYPVLHRVSTALKHSLPHITRQLRAMLPKAVAEKMLRLLVFTTVPELLKQGMQIQLDKLKLAVIYSNLAFYLAACRKIFLEEWYEIANTVIQSIFYGRFASNNIINAVHYYFIEQEKYTPDGLCVFENEMMADIKSNLLDTLKNQYKVIYLQQKIPLSNAFTFLIFAVFSARSVAVVTTKQMHENAVRDRQILQIWHGCGLMKKILPVDPKKYRQNYIVASSEACRQDYASIFRVQPEHVLAFGNVPSDKYFDAERVALAQKTAREEFPDLKEKRVCFFAPTYRQANASDLQKYYCKWDYSELDNKLADANTALVYRLHHSLRFNRDNLSCANTDLCDSPRGYVRESSLPDNFEWMCACDVFMTDYSSTMFYALLLNKPIVFYAPDLDHYLDEKNGNGILIDYRNDVPGPIVEETSLNAVMQAMDEAPRYVGTEKYEKFKKIHMGACDGHAIERIMSFIDGWYQGERQRLCQSKEA